MRDSGCGACLAPLDGDCPLWTARVAREGLTWLPFGLGDRPAIEVAAGAVYVLCPECSDLFAGNRFGALAERVAAGTAPVARGAVGEMAAFLLALAGRLTPPLSAAQIALLGGT